ncbi:hypothetical protein DA803_01700 [[Mycoplasma] phocae]|uniref:Uncharacterized protein n=2 Tax=[Mycoplasma] phocae TaxID=142651 RepID=A0A2Z5ISM1_9BACT|nr:hypothetical protein DA803_01700 [[Mycoplasma] phocae]
MPLIAAACNSNNSSPKPQPKPNTDQEAVNKSLDNIKVKVINKDKLPAEVKNDDVVISGKLPALPTQLKV